MDRGLDEREIEERNDASRWALQRIAGLLAIYAGLLVAQKTISSLEVTGFLVVVLQCWRGRFRKDGCCGLSLIRGR